jgi:hypothetical protein
MGTYLYSNETNGKVYTNSKTHTAKEIYHFYMSLKLLGENAIFVKLAIFK